MSFDGVTRLGMLSFVVIILTAAIIHDWRVGLGILFLIGQPLAIYGAIVLIEKLIYKILEAWKKKKEIE